MKKTCVLIVLDGWGIGRRDFSNPIIAAAPATLDYVKKNYPLGALQASGIAVGLPWNEEGNSEVGHLTIGAGKVIYQHYPRITIAIQTGEFFKNPAFLNACEHAKKNNGSLNIAGLLTEANIHSSFEHLEALVRLAAENGVTSLNLHMFMDGKDSRPRSASSLVARLRDVFERYKLGRLASFAGRYYGLDRDGHYDRTAQAYQAMTGQLAPSSETMETIFERTYAQNENDDFIEPTVIGPEAHGVTDGDALLFLDFREDSIRQIASSFILKDFDKFPLKPFTNLYVATMTEYSKAFPVPVAFPNEEVTQPLGKVLSDAGMTQMLVAETEKYAHVTYFFNGYRDEPFKNQFRVLIPSRNVPHHDERPEMMAEEIANRVVEGIEDHSFNFILANFANADIIAHTGNYDAAVKGIRVVDQQLGRIVKACEKVGASLIITSDHGHVEKMKDPFTGVMITSHDANPVPIYLIDHDHVQKKSDAEIAASETETIGILSDVAPTVLELLGVPKPKEMTGTSLLKFLR